MCILLSMQRRYTHDIEHAVLDAPTVLTDLRARCVRQVNLPNIPNPFKGDGGDIAKQLDKAPVPTASDVKNAGDSVKDSIGGFQIPKNS